MLKQEDKNKEGEPLVSDGLSKPLGFSNIVVEENAVNGKDEGEANSNDPIQEMSFKPIQESRYVEKEQ